MPFGLDDKARRRPDRQPVGHDMPAARMEEVRTARLINERNRDVRHMWALQEGFQKLEPRGSRRCGWNARMIVTGS